MVRGRNCYFGNATLSCHWLEARRAVEECDRHYLATRYLELSLASGAAAMCRRRGGVRAEEGGAGGLPAVRGRLV